MSCHNVTLCCRLLLLLGGGCEASRLTVRGLRDVGGGGGGGEAAAGDGTVFKDGTAHKGSDIATIHYAAGIEASKCTCYVHSHTCGVLRKGHNIKIVYSLYVRKTIISPASLMYLAGEIPDCTTTGSCDCMPVGKCKPCSRLDIVSPSVAIMHAACTCDGSQLIIIGIAF